MERNDRLRAGLKADCARCSGLCCTALFFAKSDGFPCDKEAGTPCTFLAEDFTCRVHSELARKGLRGCLGYDCFGAGQWVTQSVYGGRTWRGDAARAQEMFRVFLTVYQLHQMRWYLLDAASMPAVQEREISALLEENMRAAAPEELPAFDLEGHRGRVNRVLASALGHAGRPAGDFIGKNFRHAKLDGRDFSMSLLIAADLSGCSLRAAKFLAADMRDANLCGADLRGSVFLTQGQVNAAKGDRRTRLPDTLTRPSHWRNG